MGARARRIAVWAAVAGVSLVGCLGTAWYWWLPRTVRERVAAAGERRGLQVGVGEIGIGWEGVTLRSFEARSTVEGIQVRVAEVVPAASLWELGVRGTEAVSAVSLRGVEVEIDLDASGLDDALRALQGRTSAAGPRGERGPRVVVAEDVSLSLRDRRGALARFARGRVSVDGTQIQVAGGPLVVGGSAADGLRAERVRARVVREDGELRVAHASLQQVAVRYEERPTPSGSPLWGRVRHHVAKLGGGDTAEDGESAGSSTPGESPGAGTTVGALIAAGRALLGPRLTADAVLQVTDLAVTARASGGEDEPVLRELSAELRALSEGDFQLQGSGRPGRGGRLGWRMRVHPEELRAEGRVEFQRLPFVLLTPMLPSLPWDHPEDARLSGELTVQGRGVGPMQLEGSVRVEELGVSSPRIASRPLRRIALGLDGQAEWEPGTRRLRIPRAAMSMGGARVHVAGSVEWPEDRYLIDVRATLPPTECNEAVGGIPAGLLDELSGFTYRGRIGGRVQLRIDSRDLDATTLDVRVADGCRFEAAPAMADVRRFQAPFVHRVLEPDGTVFEMQTGPGTASWTPIRDISPFLVHAVLGHEDGGFFSHRGFADYAIQQALIRNLRAGRYAYGASTITMQLVKNVFLRREKTLARKVQEVLLTWWVEATMRKEQILELYLNVIEYGPGVYGIRNAAHHYFGRAPDELGPAESAYLASILPSPKTYHSHWETRQLPESFRRRVARFIQILGSRRRYDPEAVALGLEQLGRFRFQGPGDPDPPEPERRGATAPLPYVPTTDRAWRDSVSFDAAEDDAMDDSSRSDAR